MTQPIDTLLLLALPASGKSEVRRYLAGLDADAALRDFGMGPTVQLDDYPYVHMMRRISQELRSRNAPPVFFESDDQSMMEPLDWGTLIQLVNDDYQDLTSRPNLAPDSAAGWLLDRFDSARRRVGADPAFGQLDSGLRGEVEQALEPDAREILHDKLAGIPDSLEGTTTVIEFARGGADGSTLPLAAPFGYAYSLAQLSPEILERARILYIWVTPEESRRKNDERAQPGPEGDASILHHGVPLTVMLGDYGTDDMAWLLEHSSQPGTVEVAAHGRTFRLPTARFDNRQDKTSFLRDEPAKWDPADVKALHDGLRGALTEIKA